MLFSFQIAGCKIKALRAKTNTYIKTPVRGEEPVFVVTGRKEDVAKAKREILSAAEHFSLIRASRKPALGGGLSGKGAPPGPPANIPGQITIQVRVPYRVVGLVVGPKGATIKLIQQQTHTYIVTPSRDKEPVFEVTGMPDNVQSARRQIEAHIALRTGNSATSLNGSSSGSTGGGSGTGGPSGNNGLGSLLGDDAAPELLASLYKNGFSSLLSGYLDQPVDAFGNVGVGSAQLPSSTGSSTCESSSSSTSSKSAIITRPELMNIWKSLGESLDVDEGLGDSPNIWSMPTQSVMGGGGAGNGSGNGGGGGSRSSPCVSTSPTDSLLTGSSCKRECLVCGDKEVTAALVPCGHNMFCLECANRICGGGDSACPICSQTVIQAIRIIA